MECNGNVICPHGKNKEFCVPCGGSQGCVHEKLKKNCRTCKSEGNVETRYAITGEESGTADSVKRSVKATPVWLGKGQGGRAYVPMA